MEAPGGVHFCSIFTGDPEPVAQVQARWGHLWIVKRGRIRLFDEQDLESMDRFGRDRQCRPSLGCNNRGAERDSDRSHLRRERRRLQPGRETSRLHGVGPDRQSVGPGSQLTTPPLHLLYDISDLIALPPGHHAVSSRSGPVRPLGRQDRTPSGHRPGRSRGLEPPVARGCRCDGARCGRKHAASPGNAPREWRLRPGVAGSRCRRQRHQ